MGRCVSGPSRCACYGEIRNQNWFCANFTSGENLQSTFVNGATPYRAHPVFRDQAATEAWMKESVEKRLAELRKEIVSRLLEKELKSNVEFITVARKLEVAKLLIQNYLGYGLKNIVNSDPRFSEAVFGAFAIPGFETARNILANADRPEFRKKNASVLPPEVIREAPFLNPFDVLSSLGKARVAELRALFQELSSKPLELGRGATPVDDTLARLLLTREVMVNGTALDALRTTDASLTLYCRASAPPGPP